MLVPAAAELERRSRVATEAKVARDFHAVKVLRLRGELAQAEVELADAEAVYRVAEQAADSARVPGTLRSVA